MAELHISGNLMKDINRDHIRGLCPFDPTRDEPAHPMPSEKRFSARFMGIAILLEIFRLSENRGNRDIFHLCGSLQ